MATLALAMAVGGCASQNLDLGSTTQPTPATQPSGADEASASFKQISDILGRPGEARDSVYTVTFPREDLVVRIEGMDIPAAAGIASTFHFYRCTCGKIVVIGEFIVTDYEANDVAYALQKQNILISSMAPFLIYEKPRLMSVRFQSEGNAIELAKAIKSALDWTGRNRSSPSPGN